MTRSLVSDTRERGAQLSHHLKTVYLQLFEIASSKTKLLSSSPPPRAGIERHLRFAPNSGLPSMRWGPVSSREPCTSGSIEDQGVLSSL
jgi:hypothetical protein